MALALLTLCTIELTNVAVCDATAAELRKNVDFIKNKNYGKRKYQGANGKHLSDH
jgi:hypothetical protein